MNRFNVTPSVFVIIRDDDGKVLLHLRARTGFMDGYYDLPSGHVEAGETLRAAAVRELKEEVGLNAAIKDLELVHIAQNNYDRPYLNFVFEASNWTGKPTIGEPEKSDDVQFFSLKALPKIVPHLEGLLETFNKDTISFAYFEPGYVSRKDA